MPTGFLRNFVVCAGIVLFLAYAGQASEDLPAQGGGDLRQLTTPSLKDMLKAAKSDDKGREGGAPAQSRAEGGFSPYLGFTDLDPTKYMVAGQTFGMLGGISYFSQKEDRPGEFGFTFAVKDNVPNRLMGYTLDRNNLIPYFSFSLSY